MNVTYDFLCTYIENKLSEQPLVLAIDGNSASGKTTLAGKLAERFSGDVIHMDDFFLPLSLRTPERLLEAGGNVHYERFLEQIIIPLTAHRQKMSVSDTRKQSAPSIPAAPLPHLTWQRFDCSVGDFSVQPCHSSGRSLLIIEGAYSMRPEFRAAYDMSLFLSADLCTQKERILHRNGPQRLNAFLEKWIPMENRYFDAYRIQQQCQFQMHAE
ncbi:MAG: uridine kinase [Lachnospiraceae bacterium]|nr:uridine kinase [Lachnospiraceae bacterium]